MSVKNKGIIIENMDLTVSPKEDFFNYVNGNWIKKTTIPEDKSAWGSFYELQEKTDNDLKEIFESLKQENYKENSDEWKAMKYYDMAMDKDTIEKEGLKCCDKYFKMIEKCKDITDLIILSSIKVPMKSLFHIYPTSDPDNSNMMIVGIWQSGLGLPEKSFYFDNDKKSVEIRLKYLEFLEKLYAKIYSDKNESKLMAKLRLDIEFSIAKFSKSEVEQRDPVKNTNKITFEKLIESYPAINWEKIFTELKINTDIKIDIGQPDFIKGLCALVEKISIDNFKDFYKANFIMSYYPYLNSEIENMIFDFYSNTLNGVKKLEPRWKRKQRLVCSDLRDAIGKIYVKKHFPEEAKAKMLELVINLKTAFELRLKKNNWMTEETKDKAIDKLNTMIFKIGYPNKWNDYSKLKIFNSFLDTGVEMTVFDTKHGEQGFDKIGKPKDKSIWHMAPYTVNAYYNSTINENVFPAGILQHPFFSMVVDDAINYGAIGAVIAHEMTHGFDDSGRHFGKTGNLEDWWTKQDSDNFIKLTKKVVEQYKKYEVLPNVFLNGELVLGEAIADLGGLSIAYDAYNLKLKKEKININEKPLGSEFTRKQMFFIGFAQIWKGKRREDSERTLVKTDPHPPGKFRVIGTLSNMKSFYEAFEVNKDNKMFLKDEEQCNIW